MTGSRKHIRVMLTPFAIVAMIGFISSCLGEERPVYSRFTDLGSNGWETGEYCVYYMSDADSSTLIPASALFNIILTLRHTTDYPYNNLWIVIDRSVSADSVASSKIELRLADSSGSWTGKGMQGIYEFSDTVIRGVRLSPHDVISIRHDMPVGSLPGILDLGLTVVPAHKNKN